MNNHDISAEKEDVKYLLSIIHKIGKISDREYKKALEKLSTYITK